MNLFITSDKHIFALETNTFHAGDVHVHFNAGEERVEMRI